MEGKKFGFYVVEKIALESFVVKDAEHLAEAINEAGKVAKKDHLLVAMKDGRSLLLTEDDRKKAVHSPYEFMSELAKSYPSR